MYFQIYSQFVYSKYSVVAGSQYLQEGIYISSFLNETAVDTTHTCVLTLSFRPKTLTFPWACSFRNRHSTRFCPFSPGRVMFLFAMVGLAVPAKTCGSVW